MSKQHILYAFVLVGLGLLTLKACLEPYEPEIDPEQWTPLLVVDGFIDASGDSDIRLSVSRPLVGVDHSSPNFSNQVEAQLFIEGENGSVYASPTMIGSEQDVTIPHPRLDEQVRYRLRIIWDHIEYTTPFQEVLVSRDIDSLGWREVDNNDVQILINTDGADVSRFYRWEFEETWQVRSAFQSMFVFRDGEVVDRPHSEQIYVCYKDYHSGEVLVNSTEGMIENKVVDFVIQTIPFSTERLDLRYSINVRQFQVSADAHYFWDLLRQNSEDLGDLFGPMPGMIQGNITSDDPNGHQVIGFVDVVMPSEKRIFIRYNQLESLWIYRSPLNAGCVLNDIPIAESNAFFARYPSSIPVAGLYQNDASPYPTHYTYGPERCVDCRFRGTLEEPDFWGEH